MAGPYLAVLLKQNLIIFAQSNTEDNGRHIFEAMYPLLPFTTLTTNVEHAWIALVRAI
jgi:hypothetical protein